MTAAADGAKSEGAIEQVPFQSRLDAVLSHLCAT